MKSKVIIGIILGVFLIYLVYGISQLWWGPTIPPEIDSYNLVLFCAKGIKIYYEKNGILPESLYDVSDKNGLRVCTSDFWGNQIVYRKTEEGLVSLISYGSDGKEGGLKSKSDIVMSFYPKNADSFYKMCHWSSPPENTTHKMVYLKIKINEYYEKYKKMPMQLGDLQIDSNYFSNNDKDYWGNAIIYKTDDSKVTLLSYGLDGKEGGVGENEDIILCFRETGDSHLETGDSHLFLY